MPEVSESGIIDASADQVWAMLRDFTGAKNWAENMASSDIEDGRPGTQVGVVRRLVFQSGNEVREQLIALSDDERYFRYAMLSTETLPIRNYSGRVRVIPVTDCNASLVEWSGRFSIAEGEPEQICDWVRGIYKAGIKAMRTYIRGYDQ